MKSSIIYVFINERTREMGIRKVVGAKNQIGYRNDSGRNINNNNNI